MTKNKEIYLIHCKYGKAFRKICKNILVNYKKTLPIEWEDIYYKFLYLAPKILKKFDQKLGVSKDTFLFLECQYFAHNECRKWATNNHKVMNFRTDLAYENSLYLSDSDKNNMPIDISLLKGLEIEIYNLYFLEGKNISEIHRELSITLYKVRRVLSKVKEKLNVQLV